MQPVVAVVEDDPAIRDFICAALKDEGYQVVMAVDGLAATNVIIRARPAMALLDLMLPGQSGLEVIRQLRASATLDGLCIIAMSAGYNLRALAQQGLAVDGILPKPFDLDTLFAVINHCLQRGQAAH